MKKIFILLFSLISISSFAQNFDFSVGVARPFKARDWVYQNEGDFFTGFNFYAYSPAQPTPHPPTTALTTVWSSLFQTAPGFLTLFDNSIVFNCDGPGFLTITVNKVRNVSSSLDRISQTYTHTFGAAGGEFTIPGRIELDENGTIVYTLVATTTTNPNATISATGIPINAGQDYNAPNLYLAIGDSQTYTALGNLGGGSIGNYGNTLYSRRIVDSLNAAGIKTRLITKGISGGTTLNNVNRILSGELDEMIRYASWIELHVGTNDAAAGTAAASNYQALMEQAIDYCLLINPTASYIITSPPPSDKSPIPTNIGGYKTIMAALPGLSKYSGKHLYYMDVSTSVAAPSGANDPNWTETVVGTYVHLRGDTGHLAQFSFMWPLIKNTYAYLHHR